MSQRSIHIFSVYTSGDPYYVVSIPFFDSSNYDRIVNAINTSFPGASNSKKRSALLKEFINNNEEYMKTFYYLQPGVGASMVTFSKDSKNSTVYIFNSILSSGITIPLAIDPNTNAPIPIPYQEITLNDDTTFLSVNSSTNQLIHNAFGGTSSNITKINCSITNQLIDIKKNSTSSDPIMANFSISIQNVVLHVELACKLRLKPVVLYRSDGTLGTDAKHGILYDKNILLASKIVNETKT